MWRFGGACLSAFMSKADLLFSPCGNTLPLAQLAPVVATIHDVTPVVFPAYPKHFARRISFALGNSARFSRAIITDSICSKRDLIDVFGIPDSKVHVVYLGYDPTIFNDAALDVALQKGLQKRLGIEKRYICHHGTIQPRKNIRRLIQAYRLALSRNPNLDLDLVLVGQLGWQYKEIVWDANETGREGRVLLTGPLSDQELAILTKSATLAVVPSLYEGFCLPLLEAMACGTPTICSNSSCLPEVSGGVLKYFDPLSVEEMATCIDEAVEDREVREGLSLRGKERASTFNWQRCAEETLAVLRGAVGN
jgi:glycosyltransferase involved in cell wall biosynthesis